MNRQNHFEVDPFSCFRKGHVVRKAVRGKCGIRDQGGGSFHEYCRKKKTSMVVRKRGKPSGLAMSNRSRGLATSSTEGRVITRCGFVKLFDWLLGASQPTSQVIVALRGENVFVW